MKYLIDTHVCLWAVAEKQKLSARVKEILENPENEILYSQVSLLEIAIKFQVGKLPDFKVPWKYLMTFFNKKVLQYYLYPIDICLLILVAVSLLISIVIHSIVVW